MLEIHQLHCGYGRRSVLAVSPGGVVAIAEDGARWDGVFGGQRKPEPNVMFEPDVAKRWWKKSSGVPWPMACSRNAAPSTTCS